MGQLSNISGKEAVKAFQAAGWQVRGQLGSHVMLTKTGERANLPFRNTKSCPPARCGS